MQACMAVTQSALETYHTARLWMLPCAVLPRRNVSMVEFRYEEIFEHGPDTTEYRKLTSDYVSTTTFEGQGIVKIAPEALTLLAREAMDDVAHLLRPGHLRQLANILDDPEASDNDR